MTQYNQPDTQFHSLDPETKHKETVISLDNIISILKVEDFRLVMLSALKRGIASYSNQGLGKLIETEIQGSFQGQNRSNYNDNMTWFNRGVECQILQPGQNWQKGKVRFRLVMEFAPDAPEDDSYTDSPLDDIRQMSDNS